MGASVNAEMIVRGGDRPPPLQGNAVDALGNPIPIEAPRNGLGWFVQAGYLIPGIDFVEVSARVGMIHPIGDASQTSLGEHGELGACASYYFAEHAFKLQLDYFHLWNGGDFGDSEDRVRLQLQGSL
jgi:hypothetical protein